MREYLIKSNDPVFLEKHPQVRSGVGLAAPQIGKNIRMFAVLCEDKEQIIDVVLLNPKISEKSQELCYLPSGEGCLSVNDEHLGLVMRHRKITIEGYDLLANSHVQLTLENFPAVVFQHEYDHLDGILFYDRIDKDNPTLPLDGAICLE